VTTHPERDSAVREDDCVEVLLDPAGDAKGYKHFIVNPLGTQSDARDQGTPQDWDAQWDCATSAGLDRWTVEMRIPLTALEVKGFAGTWGINLGRARRTVSPAQELAYQGAPGAIHTAKAFARMRFE